MINIFQLIRQVINRMFPAKSIEQVERIDSPLTSEMVTALETWGDMYTGKAPWLKEGTVKSLNLPALIASEIARQVVMEAKWNITGGTDDKSGEDLQNPRSEYLRDEFKKLMDDLRLKLEQGCAAGGMTIKPYPKDGHLFFDWTMDWSLYPISFTNDHRLKDVIFRDSFQDGKVTYSRLERHTLIPEGIRITQRAFKSLNRETIGSEIPLSEVEMWKGGAVLLGWIASIGGDEVFRLLIELRTLLLDGCGEAVELRVGVRPPVAAFLRSVASGTSAVAVHSFALLSKRTQRERRDDKRDDEFVHGLVPVLLIDSGLSPIRTQTPTIFYTGRTE